MSPRRPPEPIRRNVLPTPGEKYPCLFSLTEDCPVRRQYKLKPENLVAFCHICPVLKKVILEIERA